MDIKFHRTLIFDGSHALHRNLSVPNNWEMTNNEGQRTGGIFGVLRTINKEITTYNYTPIVVFDGGLSQRRLELFPNYKGTLDKQILRESLDRTEEDLINEQYREEYIRQRDILIELLPCLGIPVIYQEGWEGDDLIYLLTKLSKDSIVVSDDKDLIQLISESDRKCRIRRAMRDEFWDINKLKEMQLDIQTYIGCKAIIGDPSDKIPSACFQVGEKTALDLYNLFTYCVENNITYPENEDELKKLCETCKISKRKAYLNFNKDQFLINYLLTDLSLVDKELNDNFINTIIDTVNKYLNYENLEYVKIILDKLNIYSINIDSFYSAIKNRNKYIDLSKIEETSKEIDIFSGNKGFF